MLLNQALDSYKFKENHNFSNWKIFLGFISILFTAGAYLNGKSYPENVPIIGVCLVGYFIFSTAFWLLENYIIGNTFITSVSTEETEPFGFPKNNTIRLSSEVKERTADYTLKYSLLLKNNVHF